MAVNFPTSPAVNDTHTSGATTWRWDGTRWDKVTDGAAGGVLSGTYPNPSFASDMATQAELDAAIATREPSITSGTASQYWRGNKTWADFFTDVRASTLTGLSTATNAVITATDTVLSALGKLQKQVSDNLSALTSHTSNTSNPHSTTKAQVGLGNVDNTSDADKPVSAATQTALNAKQNTANPASTGAATHTGTGTGTSGFVTSDNVAFTVQPSAAGSTALYTAKFGTLTYSGSHAMAFPAHAIGTFGKVIWSPSANVQADLLLGAEGTIEVTAGSVLLAYGVVGTINAVSAGRTIAEAAGLYGKCTANSGTITSFWIAKGEIPGNSGTIGQHGGYYIPDCSGVSGITTRVGFVNDDPAAPNISDSPSYGPIGQASKQEIAPMPHPGYVAGRYYTPLDHATPTPVGLSANLMYLVPFAVAQRTTFTRIGIKCTTAQAATNARLGIYRAIDGVASNLVLDAGTVSLATTGDKELTISQQLEAGDYFLAVLSNATTAQITWSLVNIAMRAWRYGLVGSDTADGAADLLMIAGFTYGALPATCPAVTFVGSTAVEPRIWLRKV